MTQIIVVNAFRGGVGKSTITANLAAMLAVAGKRVAVADVDFQSSGLSLHFGVDNDEIGGRLNDYVFGGKSIEDVVLDITHHLDEDAKGKLFLLPSSMDLDDLKRIRQEGYDPRLLTDGLCDLLGRYDLDVLFLKTPHGLSDQILVSIAISDLLLVVMRPDTQDYEGTGIILSAARALDVPQILLIVNEVPSGYDLLQVKAEIETTYKCPVATVLPFYDEIAELKMGDGLFTLRHPDHPMTLALKQAMLQLIQK